MLLDNNYTIVPSIRFTLRYDNGICKVITVKTKDTIDCAFKKNGEKFTITGVVSKIGCNFNSSLGAVGTSAYLQVDGSSEYCGQVEYIQPSQVLDLTILSTSGEIDNVVCSVDNEDQKITLIRENEVGVFQYSLDGITWRAANGAQGMSAYECAVALGFEGSESEWLASLKGKPGDPGEPGALEIYKVFYSIKEAEVERDLVPKGKLVAVVHEPNSLLFVRNSSNNAGVCKCCQDNDENIRAKGYDYLGYLTVGPEGKPGRPGTPGKDGKSAYEYAVEGGFPGTEDEFMDALSNTAVAVTNFYMGPCNTLLENTVIGPIDLRIFGFTEERHFKSKVIKKIDISCPNEPEDQTLIFPIPVILRAVPTMKESAKPNVIINGRPYVADCIMRKRGQVGVMRRIKYIESYNGETILGDWISSTGELDMGAKVEYVTYAKFEPFSEEVQSQYMKLHSYDLGTEIKVDDNTHISVCYPINVSEYIKSNVETITREYIEEKAPEIVRPIVQEEIEEPLSKKQDTLTPGDHIDIDEDNTISVTDIGDLPEGKTVTQVIDENVSTINTKITAAENRITAVENNKQAKLTAGENIKIENNVISSSANTKLSEEMVVTKAVGGVSLGTVYPVGTDIVKIIRDILCPDVPPDEYKIYFGVSKDVPTSLEGLTPEVTTEYDLITNGATHRFTSDDQRFIFAYRKTAGELISIKDPSGFEQLDGWSRTTCVDGDNEFYIYYSKETLTVTSYKMQFIFTD